MSLDKRIRFQKWLETGEARLYPLTLSQRELWETSPAAPADVSNHICCLIKVRGAISSDDCIAATRRVVERQEALRTSFLPGKNGAVQLVRSSSEPAIRLREVPARTSAAEIEALARETFHEPFDLVQGPLWRAEIIRRATDDYVMPFAIHHAVADGWSLGLFLQDLTAAYLLQRSGAAQKALPPVQTPYSAWAAAERALWPPAEVEKRAGFWKSRLAASRRLWTIPEDSDVVHSAQRIVSELPPDVTAGVRDLARRNGTTLFNMLLAAFQLTLSRWTGENDITVGTPVANRTRPDIRETMGYFSGIVPLRGQVERDRPFSEHVRSVHENTVDCFANAMPYSELVAAVGDRPSPRHNPIFQVRFALQNHPVPDMELPGMSFKLRMRSTGTPRFDLGCEITEKGASLEVVWLFRQNLFSQPEIEQLARLFQSVVEKVCRSPETRTIALTI
jgi:hypothetical protein